MYVYAARNFVVRISSLSSLQSSRAIQMAVHSVMRATHIAAMPPIRRTPRKQTRLLAPTRTRFNAMDERTATALRSVAASSQMRRVQPLQPMTETHLLTADASPAEFEAAVQTAKSSVISQNFVATFRSLPHEILSGATPMQKQQAPYFTQLSWEAVQERRAALRSETARMTQVNVDTISPTHPEIVRHMGDGSLSLFLHLPYIVHVRYCLFVFLHGTCDTEPQHLNGAAAVAHNFSSGICWLRWPSSTALVFSSGRVVMTGCQSAEECKLAATMYVSILKSHIPDLPWQLLEWKVHTTAISLDIYVVSRDLQVQNVVCSGATGFLIDLAKLQALYPSACNLDVCTPLPPLLKLIATL